MGKHLIDGKFKSDKYPTCPAGKVPLSVEDPMAWDDLWNYSIKRRGIDAEFADDLQASLLNAGFIPMLQGNVRVGVSALLWRGDHVLLGLRKGSHGAGTWSLPGGHLEMNESVIECANREVLEETGLDTRCYPMDRYVHTHFKKEGKSYITLYTSYAFQPFEKTEVKLMEPDKCSEWRWVRYGSWPNRPLFKPFKDYLTKYDKRAL